MYQEICFKPGRTVGIRVGIGRPSDVLKPTRKVNYARVEAKELPGLLHQIEVYSGTPVTRLAMKLMALTFVQTGELIGARWSEFDVEAARWDIPAERMKMRTRTSSRCPGRRWKRSRGFAK